MDIDELKDFRSKLRIIENEVSKQIKEDTICCGVTLSQCHILVELNILKEASIIDLARILELDKSTLSRTIDGMVNIGLVSRKINKDDRRYMKVSLTVSGEKAAKNIDGLCNEYYENLFNLIPEEKHKMIIESIEYLGNAMKTLRENDDIKCCKTGENDE